MNLRSSSYFVCKKAAKSWNKSQYQRLQMVDRLTLKIILNLIFTIYIAFHSNF